MGNCMSSSFQVKTPGVTVDSRQSRPGGKSSSGNKCMVRDSTHQAQERGYPGARRQITKAKLQKWQGESWAAVPVEVTWLSEPLRTCRQKIEERCLYGVWVTVNMARCRTLWQVLNKLIQMIYFLNRCGIRHGISEEMIGRSQLQKISTIFYRYKDL